MEKQTLILDASVIVKWFVNELLTDKAIINSKKFDKTIYDSIYVSLAQIHGADLITADSELFKIPNVISLDRI